MMRFVPQRILMGLENQANSESQQGYTSKSGCENSLKRFSGFFFEKRD